MPSERVQRQIRLLDQAEAAVSNRDWKAAREAALAVLVADPEKGDAKTFLAMAEKSAAVAGASGDGIAVPKPTSASSDRAASGPTASGRSTQSARPTTEPVPFSFANGRYAVKKKLGEGGKKKVYLAHDTVLDRDVAFAPQLLALRFDSAPVS